MTYIETIYVFVIKSLAFQNSNDITNEPSLDGHYGGLAEWSKAAVLKTVVGQLTVGSNPASSAKPLRWFVEIDRRTRGVAEW